MVIAKIPPPVQLTGPNIVNWELNVVWSLPCPQDDLKPPVCLGRTLPYKPKDLGLRDDSGLVLALRYNYHYFTLVVPDSDGGCPTLIEHRALPTKPQTDESFHGAFCGVMPSASNIGATEGLVLVSKMVVAQNGEQLSCRSSVLYEHVCLPAADRQAHVFQWYFDVDEYSSRICCVLGRYNRQSKSPSWYDESFVSYTFR